MLEVEKQNHKKSNHKHIPVAKVDDAVVIVVSEPFCDRISAAEGSKCLYYLCI